MCASHRHSSYLMSAFSTLPCRSAMCLSLQVAAVVGVDNVQSAIDDAHSNAQLNGIDNATFVCGPAEKVLASLLQVGC